MQAYSRAPGRCGCCTLPRARKVHGPRARSRRRSSAWSTSQPTAAPAVRLPPVKMSDYSGRRSTNHITFSLSCSCSRNGHGEQACQLSSDGSVAEFVL